MDHLEASFAPGQSVYDALVTVTWLAAGTSTLKLGHLVLCDSMRHPAVLAKEADRSTMHLGAGSSLASAGDPYLRNSSRSASGPRPRDLALTDSLKHSTS